MNIKVIVIGVILLVVLLYFLFSSYFSSATTLDSEYSLNNADGTIPNIPSSDISVPDAANFTYSIWLYVNSWSSTSEKEVFHRDYETRLFLDRNTSTLKLSLGNPGTSTSGENQELYKDTNIEITNNFPLQKWVCVLISVDNNIVDVYLDGKMVKSLYIGNGSTPPFQGQQSDSDIVFGSGWDAYISKFERNAQSTDPATAWKKYLEGNGSSRLKDALGNVSINLSVTKDNVETATYSIF